MIVERTPKLSLLLRRHIEPPINMLLHAIDICPDDLWAKEEGHALVWQHVLHATYYLQKWIRTPDEPFDPPAFADKAAVDLDISAKPVVSRETLWEYLVTVSNRCLDLLDSVDNETLLLQVQINDGTHTLMDQTLSQVRHLMYHVGCISSILNCHTGQPLPWVGYDTKAAIESKIVSQ